MRRGTTLVELLVVLLLLGLLAGMSALAAGGVRTPGSTPTAAAARMDRARTEAIRMGSPVRLDRDSGGPVRFLPDGQIVGGDLDPLTGAPADAAR